MVNLIKKEINLTIETLQAHKVLFNTFKQNTPI